MITIKLFSYSPDEGIKQTEFVFDDDYSMNDSSFLQKLLNAAVLPFNLVYSQFNYFDDGSVREVVLVFPSFLCDSLDLISSYLYNGLCLAFVVCSDKDKLIV